MDTNRIKQFCLVAETGSMTKAAALLYISHSGLSKSMKLLQAQIKTELFRPVGRGITLTEAGLDFYQRAKVFLEHEAKLFDQQTKSAVAAIRIATVEIFLAMLAGELTKQHPHRAIKLLDLEPGQMEQFILNHKVDYGITYVPYPMEKLEIMEVTTYQLGCYHLRGCFPNTPLTKLPFVVPACGLTPNHLGIKERDGWLDSLAPRYKKYEVNLLSTALELTLSGLCAIYLPDFLARKINATRDTQHQLVRYRLPEVIKQKQSIFLLTHQDNAHTSSTKAMASLIRKALSHA